MSQKDPKTVENAELRYGGPANIFFAVNSRQAQGKTAVSQAR